MASSSSSSSAISHQPTFRYDVFLSFRGFDTRRGFTSDLYEMLTLHNIKTFIDKHGLEAGDRIDKLFDHIRHSELFVVILSKNYGNSTWCLKEIAAIVQTGRLIIPVFINIDPSNIRKQDGVFGETFDEKTQNEEPEDVDKWRKALKAVGELSGYVLKDKTHRDEVALAELVTKNVVRRIKKPLDVAEHPVSKDARAKHVMQMLLLEDDRKDVKVLILAIAGLGGIGKSTLARGLYNRLMREFDSCCFLPNVRETSTKKGPKSLQKQLIRDITKQAVLEPKVLPKAKHVEYANKSIKNKL